MVDTDVIAQVLPYKDDLLLLHARTTIENSPRCVVPSRRLQQQEHNPQIRNSRESTVSRENEEDETSLPYLEIRFSQPPRSSSGLVFGTDERICDVVLPDIRGLGISKRHFALTYKSQFPDGFSRLIIRDLASRHGTEVTYDGKGGKLRSDFDWILDGFVCVKNTDSIIVQLHEKVKFKIIVTRQDIASQSYINNVRRFHEGFTNPQGLLSGLDLESGPQTERNTGTHTPVKHPILLPMGWVGKGGFGVVSRHWNVSTGEEYACKQPVSRSYDRRAWEKEINIMKAISHVSKTLYLSVYSLHVLSVTI